MTDKDKEAFEGWYSEENAQKLWEDSNGDEVVTKAWQAACEYMRDEFKFQTPPAVFIYQDINDKLQAENKKLREALEFYGNTNSWIWTKTNLEYDRIDPSDTEYVLSFATDKIGGKRAREALKEIKEN
jgi:hypothetical protein